MIWNSNNDYINKEASAELQSKVDNWNRYDIYTSQGNVYVHNSACYSDGQSIVDFVEVPDEYPFDLVVSKDSDNSWKILAYDNYRNGNGNVFQAKISKLLITIENLEIQYLMPLNICSNFAKVISAIKVLNSERPAGREKLQEFKQSEYIALQALQDIQRKSSLILHASLLSELIEIPDTVQIELVSEEEDYSKVSVQPYVESESIGKVNIDLKRPIRSRSQSNSNNGITRTVLSKELIRDLNKLKELSSISVSAGTKDMDFIANPSAFLDVSNIDFSTLSERVIEIGKYNPQYYSFLIPGKRGRWIPNIQVENSVTKEKINIKVESHSQFATFQKEVENSITNGSDNVSWGGESIPLKVAKALMPKFRKAFDHSDRILKDEVSVSKTSDTMVLVIYENAIELDYTEAIDKDIQLSADDVDFTFYRLDNLTTGISLRDHQQRGVASIQYLMNNPEDFNGVVLADDMGLGKTIQVLYLIEYYASKGFNKPCIIVAPVSLLNNWKKEYDKFFDNRSYDVKIVRGSDIPKGEYFDENVLKDLEKKQLILTNYETFRDAQMTFAQIDFGVMAIDEAQRIKTPGTMITSAIKASKADFKIAMTGTPVENTMVDLWSIVDFIQPGLFDSAKTFHSTYQKPMEDTTADHEDLVKQLRSRLGLQFIRRLKKDVAKDLPFKKEVPVECPLTPTQIQYYSKVSHEFDITESNNPLPFIHKLKLLCDCPLLLDYNLADLSVEELVSSTSRLQALHGILTSIFESSEKVILFSEYRKTQEMLRKVVLAWFGYNSTIINGSTSTEDTKTQLSRQSLIDEYQAKQGFGVIVMSPIAAGVGLNVTAANHVVHYSRHWNPAKESQATDRAYRIGQTKDVNVYYLISTHQEFDTFDIVLDKLLRRKALLATNSMYPSSVIEVSESEMVKAMSFDNLPNVSFEQNYSFDQICKFLPLEFEVAIAAIYQSIPSFDAYLTPKSNDYGADVVCFSDQGNLLIQVKQSKNPLNNNAIQEVLGAVSVYEKKYNLKFTPVVVSNSTLNSNAQRVARDSNVQFVKLIDLMRSNDVESISLDTLSMIRSKIIDKV